MRVGWSFRSTTMFYSVVGVTYLTVSGAYGADFSKLPLAGSPPPFGAVDGVNGKFDVYGGTLANRSLTGTRGSVAIPLQGWYGAQIDASAGTFGGRSYGSVGGHAFWRDPNRGLLGLYSNHTWWNQLGGAYVGQIAGEGEYYFGRWTLQGIAGIEFGNTVTGSISSTNLIPPGGGGVPGIATVNTFSETIDIKTRFFNQINLKYYLTDNWDAYIGHRYLGGKNAFAVGSEYAFPLRNGVMAAGFIEGRVGENSFHGVWGGVRFYFGQRDKTLMARHRQDDPWFWDALPTFTNNISRAINSAVTAFCAGGGAPSGGSCEGGIFDPS